MAGMGIITSLLNMLDLRTRAEAIANTTDATVPPPRMPALVNPMNMIPVCRGVQILETAIRELPLEQRDQDGNRVRMSGIMRDPSPGVPRGELIANMVADLAFNGNLFLHRVSIGGTTWAVRQLPSNLVTAIDANNDPDHPDMHYWYGGVELDPKDVIHRRFICLPGMVKGVGPITMARLQLQGMSDTEAYASNWRNDGSIASAVLSSDQTLTDADASQAKDRMMNSRRGGEPLVLGKGLHYERIAMSPEDMQFLQTRSFDVTSVARMLGIPANLLLASVEGSSLTYQNIEQSWIEFSSYTLQAYVMPICDAFSQLVPYRQYVTVDWDSARRSDTKSRYEAYKLAIEMGLMDIDEARRREGVPPRNENTTNASTPAGKEVEA